MRGEHNAGQLLARSCVQRCKPWLAHHLNCVASFAVRWTHIEDLDEFFTRVYQYHQRSGFLCMFVGDLLNILYVARIGLSFFLTHLLG